MTRRSAFTIPEMLAVVAIIVIILSMLMPSISRARLIAQRTVCQTNQRSIVIGLQAYSIQSASVFPTPYKAGQDWADAYGLRDDFPYTGAATRDPLGMGLLVSNDLLPAGDLPTLMHCPSFDNAASTVAPGHCMDVAHPNGYGGSGWSAYPKHRIIGSYNYRGTSFYWSKKRVMRRADATGRFIMMIDTPDFRFRGQQSQFNKHGGYNVVFSDGSSVHFADIDYYVDGLAQAAGGRRPGRRPRGRQQRRTDLHPVAAGDRLIRLAGGFYA